MLESYEIENIEQLRAIADMLRLRIFEMLQQKPMTVTQLGEELGEAPAKVHYHVRELEKVGLLRLVETCEKGGWNRASCTRCQHSRNRWHQSICAALGHGL